MKLFKEGRRVVRLSLLLNVDLLLILNVVMFILFFLYGRKLNKDVVLNVIATG